MTAQSTTDQLEPNSESLPVQESSVTPSDLPQVGDVSSHSNAGTVFSPNSMQASTSPVIRRSATARRSLIWIRRWLRKSKPTEWITSLAILLGVWATWRSGLIDTYRAEVSARNERLTLEQRQLEQHKGQLTEEVASSKRELEETKARLLPLEHEQASIRRIKNLGTPNSPTPREKHSYVITEIGFTNDFDGFFLVAHVSKYYDYPRDKDEPVAYSQLAELLSLASEMHRLKELRLSSFEIDPAHIELLNQQRHLRSLSLYGTGITNGVLANLALPDSVQELSFRRNRLTKAPSLPNTDKVLSLSLAENPISDEGIAGIAEFFPSLRLLNLEGTLITDDGLVRLLTLDRLHTLNLNNTRVTGPGLMRLPVLPKLDIILIEREKVSQQILNNLRTKFKNVICRDERDNPPPPPPSISKYRLVTPRALIRSQA